MPLIPKPGTEGSPITLQDRYDNWINNEWVPPTKGEYFENPSPVNGKVYTEVARSSAEDIEKALDAAWQAFPAWSKTSATERSNLLLQMADRMQENIEAIAAVESWDNGKAIREPLAADIPWRSITCATSPLRSVPRRVGSRRSTTTPSPITSTNRSVWSARSFRGTSRC